MSGLTYQTGCSVCEGLMGSFRGCLMRVHPAPDRWVASSPPPYPVARSAYSAVTDESIFLVTNVP